MNKTIKITLATIVLIVLASLGLSIVKMAKGLEHRTETRMSRLDEILSQSK